MTNPTHKHAAWIEQLIEDGAPVLQALNVVHAAHVKHDERRMIAIGRRLDGGAFVVTTEKEHAVD